MAVAADVGRTRREFANSGGDGEDCSCSESDDAPNREGLMRTTSSISISEV